MANFTQWKRVDFGDPYGVPKQRAQAIEETNQDLQKPIQQLVCDTHEMILGDKIPPDQRVNFAMLRAVSLMGRVALEHERNHKSLVWLTWVITILTLVLVVLTGFLLFHH
jgi:hypothetical protein